jgi:VanZ family protein
MPPLAYRRLWTAIGWTLVLLVCYLSLVPVDDLPPVEYNDKVAHASAYFGLMFWFAQLSPRRLRLTAAFLAMGATIELLQGLSGYRDMSALDMLANTTGVLLAFAAARFSPNLLLRLESVLP